MKPVLTIILSLFTLSCFSQKIFVPYRSGKLFGLSDGNGKIIVEPQYDNVHWMQGTWFETSKKIELKDTIETSPGRFFIRNSKTTLTGLINNGSVILAEEPFEDYEIVARKFIVGMYERRLEELTKAQIKKYGQPGNQRKLYSIFNLKGENLYPGNFKRIQKIDTAGISAKDKKSARYIAFAVQHFNDRYSMIVLDADQQKISEWLVKEVIKIEGDKSRRTAQQIGFTITEETYGKTKKVLDYSNGKFILTSTPSAPPEQKPGRREQEELVEITDVGPGGYNDVAVPNMEGEKVFSPKKPAFNPYHIKIKDTLYYLTSYEDRHPVKLSAGGKVILLEPKGMTQYQPVIVKNNNQFYIVKEDQLSNASYDSLIYYGKYFLAWQKTNGQTKAGVIDADGTIVLPLEYDSVYADIKYFNLKNTTPASNKANYIIDLTEADSKYNFEKPYPYKRSLSSFLTVFKNGYCGIVNLKGETIVPIQYDLIARNNLQHSRPMTDDFLIIQQKNQYGLANFKYNEGKKSQELIFIVAPMFDYIPGFFYADYYGIKDYKLVGLYSDQFEFKGYANESGKLFYDK